MVSNTLRMLFMYALAVKEPENSKLNREKIVDLLSIPLSTSDILYCKV